MFSLGKSCIFQQIGVTEKLFATSRQETFVLIAFTLIFRTKIDIHVLQSTVEILVQQNTGKNWEVTLLEKVVITHTKKR